MRRPYPKSLIAYMTIHLNQWSLNPFRDKNIAATPRKLADFWITSDFGYIYKAERGEDTNHASVIFGEE